MKYSVADLVSIHTYHTPTEVQVELMQEIREKAVDLALTINRCLPDCADKMDALRKVREAQMTANAGIMLKGKV